MQLPWSTYMYMYMYMTTYSAPSCLLIMYMSRTCTCEHTYSYSDRLLSSLCGVTDHKFRVSSWKVLRESEFNKVLLPHVREGDVETRDSILAHPLLHEVREILARHSLDGLHQLRRHTDTLRSIHIHMYMYNVHVHVYTCTYILYMYTFTSIYSVYTMYVLGQCPCTYTCELCMYMYIHTHVHVHL